MLGALIGLFVFFGIERTRPIQSTVSIHVHAHRAGGDGVEPCISAVAGAVESERSRRGANRFVFRRLFPLNDKRLIGFKAQFFGLRNSLNAGAPQVHTMQDARMAQKFAAVGDCFTHLSI